MKTTAYFVTVFAVLSASGVTSLPIFGPGYDRRIHSEIERVRPAYVRTGTSIGTNVGLGLVGPLGRGPIGAKASVVGREFGGAAGRAFATVRGTAVGTAKERECLFCSLSLSIMSATIQFKC